MKVLTPDEMREVDRRTIEAGMPGLILMENAGSRVVEFLVERFGPRLEEHRIVVVCGKGNNGGDGLVVARQLLTRFRPKALDVFLVAEPTELKGDAAANYRMFLAAGGTFAGGLELRMGAATIVVDALLGTGVRGNITGPYAEWIERINTSFPAARIVAVDVPSGLGSDSACVKAHHTVTFTAPKLSMVVSPGCEAVGEMVVGPIGSPAKLMAGARIDLIEPADFAHLLEPRKFDSHKGAFGHVLIAGGGPGKTGAAAMAGLAALRVGAGLVTVAASNHAGFAPELMTAQLSRDLPFERKTVAVIGPGLGTDAASEALVRDAAANADLPLVLDADALTALAGVANPWDPHTVKPRILTPHPGEMYRLDPESRNTDRISSARRYAERHGCCVVLKGHRTVIAFADGRVAINPTGSPAMAKGGTGDVLTGWIAGLIAQHPADWEAAVKAAVYCHGLAGEEAAKRLGDAHVLATDLLVQFPLRHN